MSLLFLAFLLVICIFLPSFFTLLEGIENQTIPTQVEYSSQIMDDSEKYTEEKVLGPMDISSNTIP
jgi:hypothetical protein